MKILRLLAFLVTGLSAVAVAQTSTRCTELVHIETTVCTFDDGSGTYVYHGGNDYDVHHFDAKTWPVNREMLLQKDAHPVFMAPEPKFAVTPVMPVLAGPNAAQFKTKKTCLRAGFHWDKTGCY